MRRIIVCGCAGTVYYLVHYSFMLFICRSMTVKVCKVSEMVKMATRLDQNKTKKKIITRKHRYTHQGSNVLAAVAISVGPLHQTL